jgi:hypothetical protein
MTRLAQKFVNPANGDEYTWPVNHSQEGEVDLAQGVTSSAATGNGNLVLQQGDEQPMTFTLEGTIFAKAQVEAFRKWLLLCKTQTIDFHKFDGDVFTVLITDFKPKQKPVVHNPKDSANAPLWIWTYQMQMTVVAVKSGVYLGVVT